MADFKDTLKSKKKQTKSGVKNKKIKSPKKARVGKSRTKIPKSQSIKIPIYKPKKPKDPNARSNAMKKRWQTIKSSPDWNDPEAIARRKAEASERSKAAWAKRKADPNYWSEEAKLKRKLQASNRAKKVPKKIKPEKVKDPNARSKAMKERWAKIKASPEWNTPEAVAKRKAEASERSASAWAKRKADPNYWSEEAKLKRKQQASESSKKAWEKIKSNPEYMSEEAVAKRKMRGKVLQAWKDFRKLEREGGFNIENPSFVSDYENLDEMISEQEIIIKNMETDLAFLDSLAQELTEYKPSSNLSERLQQLKEADATTLQTILDNAIAREGKEAVARRLNDNAGTLKDLVQSVLYDSGSKSNRTGRDGFQVKVNEIARIINGSAMSLDDTKEISQIFDKLQQFNM